MTVRLGSIQVVALPITRLALVELKKKGRCSGCGELEGGVQAARPEKSSP
jgi:hypothetical protein